jgi:L-aspartate oxidase
MRQVHTDILVIGSGVAGLSYAVKVSELLPSRSILMVTKSEAEECNTRYAQGGIAAVMDSVEDSFEQHINDTLIAGDGLCNPAVVTMVVREGPLRIKELMDLGASFDLLPSGKLALAKEGGHSTNRILHSKDHTGLEIQKTLLQALRVNPKVEVWTHKYAVDLLTNDEGRCCGAWMLDANGEKVEVCSGLTVLATGGAGQVYEMTTNPRVASGDGIAMAFRAGAKLENMAFIQFHPTALYETDSNPSFLISEAVRGFGAELRNHAGEKFMERYDERGSLATRDIVARAVFSEMKLEDKNHQYLDLRHLDLVKFEDQFPSIFKKCDSMKLQLGAHMIPIAPAAHYLCGGVKVDLEARTNVEGLLCLGEMASTGMHGANRLASNSLLEALVFAHRAAMYSQTMIETANHVHLAPFPVNTNEFPAIVDSAHIVFQLRKLMSKNVGIVRSIDTLKASFLQLEQWQLEHQQNQDIDDIRLRNMLIVAKAIVLDSLHRSESRGGLYFERLNE